MMQGWQDWIVALIVTLCVGRVGLSFWRLYQQTRHDNDPCAHCSQPCDIKRQYDQKRRNAALVIKKLRNLAANSWQFKNLLYICIRIQ